MDDEERLYKKSAYEDALEIANISFSKKEIKKHLALRIRDLDRNEEVEKRLNDKLPETKPKERTEEK